MKNKIIPISKKARKNYGRLDIQPYLLDMPLLDKNLYNDLLENSLVFIQSLDNSIILTTL
jgi:hypothetical protein